MKTPIAIGQNIAATIDGKKLVIEIDLSKSLGESKSGKSINIATTNGNKALPDGASIGLNVYRSK